jgi:hypothetical protein
MSKERIKERASAIAKFYLERPVSEAREVLDEAFRQITSTSHVHDYAVLLREYADFLENSADWKPDRFGHWKRNPNPFGQG